MNRKKLMVLLTAGALTLTSANSALVLAAETGTESSAEEAAVDAGEAGAVVSAEEAGVAIAADGDSETAVFAEDGTPVKKTVKACDLTFPLQDSYEYPYMGLKFSLPDALKKLMDNSDVIMTSAEEWTEDMTGIQYAFIHWNKLTEEQKNEDVNLLGTGYDEFLESIERIGTLGVYSTDVIDDLDSITGCNEHSELGTSADGKFKYYLSTNKDAESDLTDEIKKIDATITEMTPFDGIHSAFDEPTEATNMDASNVGTFSTTDVDGNPYTESVFGEYDLTLVNAFTTWCSPCVNEMPELEKLYQEMKEQGVGVVGMVMDAAGDDGKTDEEVVKKAQVLKEKTGVTYPLLIPDEGKLNGRVQGLQSFPESFFVDKDGNIVGDAIMGSNDFDGWKEAVENQLKELKSNQ